MSTAGFAEELDFDLELDLELEGSCKIGNFSNPNEGLIELPGSGGCPAGMTKVEGFCIDRFEASLLVESADGSWKAWSPYHNPGERKVKAVSLESGVAQGYISGAQAQAACENAGKRLCRDSEWLRACQGAEQKLFPYGMERYPAGFSKERPPCNERRSMHPAIELFGHLKNPFSQLKNACINRLHDTVAPSGSFTACVSDDGVYDLVGNLHEWTADPAGTFRGGYFMDTRINGQGCLYRTLAHEFKYWDYSTGFRCCADLNSVPGVLPEVDQGGENVLGI